MASWMNPAQGAASIKVRAAALDAPPFLIVTAMGMAPQEHNVATVPDKVALNRVPILFLPKYRVSVFLGTNSATTPAIKKPIRKYIHRSANKSPSARK